MKRFIIKFAILASLPSISCSPVTPKDFYQFGLDRLKKNMLSEAKSSFLHSYLLTNAYHLDSLADSRAHIRLVPQNGNIIIIENKDAHYRLTYYDLSKASHLRNPSTFDINLERKNFYTIPFGLEKYQKTIRGAMVNLTIGPDNSIAYISSKDDNKSLALLLDKFSAQTNASTSNASQEITVFQHKNLNIKNDIFFWLSDLGAQLGFFYNNSIQAYGNIGKKVYHPALTKKVSLPFPKIGGYMVTKPSHRWQKWALLFGGGGVYKLYITQFSPNDNTEVNIEKLIEGVSSSQLIIDNALRYIIYWRGLTGNRQRYLIDSKKEKVGFPMLTKKEFLDFLSQEKRPEILSTKIKSQIEQHCTIKNLRYTEFLKKDLIFECQNYTFYSNYNNFLKIKNKKQLDFPILTFYNLGQKVVLDEQRGRAIVILNNNLYILPINVILNPDSFSQQLLELIQD